MSFQYGSIVLKLEDFKENPDINELFFDDLNCEFDEYTENKRNNQLVSVIVKNCENQKGSVNVIVNDIKMNLKLSCGIEVYRKNNKFVIDHDSFPV
jgi:hypothetical protein